MRGLLLWSLLTVGTLSASAQENKVTVNAQLRTRGEYRNGAITPQKEGEKAATFVNERARLSAQYDRGDLTLRASVQHTGVWGQDPQVDKQGRVALNEAWARLNIGEGFFAQIGRQPLVYDDERLLGALDWNVAGRAHDALKMGYADGNNQVHLILALNQNDETTKQVYYDASKGQPYKSMQTVWYHYDGHEMMVPFDISVLFMNLGFEQGDAKKNTSDVKAMQTLGTHFNVMPPIDGLKLTGSFYYQMGNDKAAWMASLKAAYRYDDNWSAHVAYDRMSGDDNMLDGKLRAFDPLFGTHHKFYGAMDLFYVPRFKTTDNYGLQDIQAGVQTKIVPHVPMELTYHYFTTAAKIQDAILGLGHELDYQLSYDVMKNVQLTAGYSLMLGMRTLDKIKGGDHKEWQDWGWVSLNVKI